MITIKIHDKEWFEENCSLSSNDKGSKLFRSLRPKGVIWEKCDKKIDMVH